MINQGHLLRLYTINSRNVWADDPRPDNSHHFPSLILGKVELLTPYAKTGDRRVKSG